VEDFLTLDKQLCFAIYETSSEFTKLYASVLQPFGLTYPQYLVLLALWEQDGITAKQLGRALNLGTGTLTPMIARMEAGGWLRKERSREDERQVHIYLEPLALTRKQPISDAVTAAILACRIELGEYETLMLGLQRLRRKLKERQQDPSRKESGQIDK